MDEEESCDERGRSVRECAAVSTEDVRVRQAESAGLDAITRPWCQSAGRTTLAASRDSKLNEYSNRHLLTSKTKHEL